MSPELIHDTAEALGAPGGRVEIAPRLSARDPLVEHVVRALAAELAGPAPAPRLYADGLAVALASRLLQGFSMTPWRLRQTLSKPQLRRIVDYVEANLDAELTLPELACVAGVSVPHLTTLFRRTMGRSVHRYVVERRVQRARAQRRTRHRPGRLRDRLRPPEPPGPLDEASPGRHARRTAARRLNRLRS
jgi:AraC family transcriptional regulator